MADKQENEKRAIDVLTDASVEVRDFADGHEERLTVAGAREIVNLLKIADMKIVPME